MPYLFTALAIATLSAADVLLVAEKNNDSVGFYDLAGGAPLASVKVGHIPHEFVFSVGGKALYVTNYGTARWTGETPGSNTISIVDLAAKKVTGKIILGEYHRPHGIELASSGKLTSPAISPPPSSSSTPSSAKS
ncbi:MAG: hypothetical protein HYX27_00715 [Acidobacteria bacterium]|nr:hypothetical protein [Acidobacteriota bacterium]